MHVCYLLVMHMPNRQRYINALYKLIFYLLTYLLTCIVQHNVVSTLAFGFCMTGTVLLTIAKARFMYGMLKTSDAIILQLH